MLHYSSDGVLHLTMERAGDQINRKIAVVKMRHTNHTLGYHPLQWDSAAGKFAVR